MICFEKNTKQTVKMIIRTTRIPKNNPHDIPESFVTVFVFVLEEKRFEFLSPEFVFHTFAFALEPLFAFALGPLFILVPRFVFVTTDSTFFFTF
jgi:hypothetical protein